MTGLEDDGGLLSNQSLKTGEAVSGGPPRPFGWALETAQPFDPILGLDNPARPVDARWRAAVYGVRKGITLPGARPDPWVDRATRYLRAILSGQTEDDRERVGREDPDLDAAFRLHAGGDKLARGIVEARLLAGQGIDATAAACGLTPGAVEAYEALFFRVTDKLDNQWYVLNNGIGQKHFSGPTEDDVDVILKRVGFFRGPIMLEQLIRYYRSGWTVPERLDGLTRPQLEELHLMLTVRCLVLAWVLPIERFHRVFLLQELLGELKAVIDAWPAPDASGRPRAGGEPHQAGPCQPGADPSLVPAGPAEQIRAQPEEAERRWAAWRAAVLAA
jgi:hypothetical protein